MSMSACPALRGQPQCAPSCPSKAKHWIYQHRYTEQARHSPCSGQYSTAKRRVPNSGCLMMCLKLPSRSKHWMRPFSLSATHTRLNSSATVTLWGMSNTPGAGALWSAKNQMLLKKKSCKTKQKFDSPQNESLLHFSVAATLNYVQHYEGWDTCAIFPYTQVVRVNLMVIKPTMTM